jgi:hypothetical protein
LEARMSYRNKTYVIFDGDNDRWAYSYMNGWKSNEKMDFNFHDAHDIGPLTDRASDETIKTRLRDRFSNAKQGSFLLGRKRKISASGFLGKLRFRRNWICPSSL